jgi:hypothetical protein
MACLPLSLRLEDTDGIGRACGGAEPPLSSSKASKQEYLLLLVAVARAHARFLAHTHTHTHTHTWRNQYALSHSPCSFIKT